MSIRNRDYIAAIVATALAFGPGIATAAEKGHEGHKHGPGEGHEEHAHEGGHHMDAHHGGVVAEVGDAHGELVIKDGKVTLYLTSHEGKELPAEGYRAMVLVLNGSARQGPVNLAHAGGNKLEGAAELDLAPGAKAIVTLMDPKGKGAQGRYALQ